MDNIEKFTQENLKDRIKIVKHVLKDLCVAERIRLLRLVIEDQEDELEELYVNYRNMEEKIAGYINDYKTLTTINEKDHIIDKVL